MTFYTARARLVRAKQWFAHGDHAGVLEGVRKDGGTLDIALAQPYSRRHVEPGDWIVSDGAGKLHVLTPAEFSLQFEDA